MSSPSIVAALLAVLATTIFCLDEDFQFELGEDQRPELLDFRKFDTIRNDQLVATIGKVFHFVIPKEHFGKEAKTFDARTTNGRPLPQWLLFDKTDGVFWGIPLQEDNGLLNITIKGIGGDKQTTLKYTIDVTDSTETKEHPKKCLPSEDNTILTLLIDKGIRTIKPKQRVVAVNNIAKFFGLPYSAFTLKPQLDKDDITDSSVVLAGPGNLHSRSSKFTSLLKVPVGCDGRLWLETTSTVHQLKQQAKDGTISEVLRLPLIGWRIKTETKPILRTKRQSKPDNYDYGSGDYEEYYDDYEDEYDDEDQNTVLPATTTTSSTSSTTPKATTVPFVPIKSSTIGTSSSHPHRHHHGEIKFDNDDLTPSRTNANDFGFAETTPIHPTSTSTHSTTTTSSTTEFSTSTTVSSTTSTTTTPAPTTPLTTTTTTQTTSSTISSTTSAATIQPYGGNRVNVTTSTRIPIDDTFSFEDYGEYDDDDDDIEGPEESETIVPDSSVFKQTPKPPIVVDFPKETTVVASEQPTTHKATSPIPEEQTTQEIIEDAEPQTVVVPDVTQSSTIQAETTTYSIPPTMVDFTTPPIYSHFFPISTTMVQNATRVPTTRFFPISTTTVVPSTTTAVPSTAITTEQQTETHLPSTTVQLTSIKEDPTTPRSSGTTIREVTQDIDYNRNFPPFIENRLKQKYVIAGKVFRFVIPEDTFKDFEDGYELKLEFLDSNERPVTKSSWCQFNPHRREVYGLPLEEDVSKWEYIIRATDTGGASVQDRLRIQVQQHKSQRVVNHEFSLHLRIEKREEFKHYIDWSLRILRALGRIYNTNMSEITVRKVDYQSEPVVFTWTNDSIPTSYCPRNDIEELFKVLTANDRGDPSRELNLALAPELRVKRVLKKGLSVCEERTTPVTPPTNFSPILRNPVDHINATVGQLLIYKVPEDTFYDPEDVDARLLNISLLTADRQIIPMDNWLQFDKKNREFFGIPKKPSRNEYQLVCVDSGGLAATDSLEVVVYPAPKLPYNVEFSMVIEVPFEDFIGSASQQKKFVEKLLILFGDSNSSHIQFAPFKSKHDLTVITWYNTSLSLEKCPNKQIEAIEQIIHPKHQGMSSHHLQSVMKPDFPIQSVKVTPLGNCKRPPPKHLPPRTEDKIIIDEPTPPGTSDEYFLTFIVPAIIISVMLFFAIVAACVLYRRRRTGKMNVEDEGRASYGNKGIPVIFQEELEEKPEAGTKAPVIFKDEKPPLAPPEYSRSGSLKMKDDAVPYQPPPPFTRTQENGKQARPKPTPTYRKPPPYVPP